MILKRYFFVYSMRSTTVDEDMLVMIDFTRMRRRRQQLRLLPSLRDVPGLTCRR